MSEPNLTNKELSVTITTEGALLTLTPRGLLEYYLPNAQEVKPGVWKGKSNTGKDVFVQTEALAGALLDCKEKQLNPVTEIYLIPANSPDKRASHKIKYTVGLERMRELPGFLGLNSGLILVKGDEMKRSQGRMVYPGWTCFGAWAKAYFVGMPEPLEHEVDYESCVVEKSPNWETRPGFMLLKVVEDELWRLKVLPRMKPKDRALVEGDAIILEAQTPAPVTGTNGQAESKATHKSAFVAGELYGGVIDHITGLTHLDTHGKRTSKSMPGSVTVLCDGQPLTCIYWTPPAALIATTWSDLIGKQAVMSFREKHNNDGAKFWFIDTLDVVAAEAAAIPTDDEPPAEEGTT